MAEENNPQPPPEEANGKTPQQIAAEKRIARRAGEEYKKRNAACKLKINDARYSILGEQEKHLHVQQKQINGKTEDVLDYPEYLLRGLKGRNLDTVTGDPRSVVSARMDLRETFDGDESVYLEDIADVEDKYMNEAISTASFNAALTLTKIIATLDKAVMKL